MSQDKIQNAILNSRTNKPILDAFSKPANMSGTGPTNRITTPIPSGAIVFKGLNFTPVTKTVIDAATVEYADAAGNTKKVREGLIANGYPKAGRTSQDGAPIMADVGGAWAGAAHGAVLDTAISEKQPIVVHIAGVEGKDNAIPVSTSIGTGLGSSSVALEMANSGLAVMAPDPQMTAASFDGVPGPTEVTAASRQAAKDGKGILNLSFAKEKFAADFLEKKKEKDAKHQNHNAFSAMKIPGADAKPGEVQKFLDEVNALWNQKKGKNKSTGEHFFKIGDVVLNIPPTHLTISQMRTSYTVNIIGNEAKPISSYHARTVIKINTIFTEGDIDQDLKRIIEQFRYCQFNLVKSDDLFSRIVGDNSWLKRFYHSTNGPGTIPVTMDSYTLYTIEGHPKAVGCTLQMSLFNFTPYFNAADDMKMEYTKFSIKKITDLSNLETTTDLEEAVHPYNKDIEDTLKDNSQIFASFGGDDESSSIVTMTKIASLLTPGMLKPDATLDVGMFSQNLTETVFTGIASSVSIQYSNNFAWVPIIGHSQPTAQYIGPGETFVTLNFKTNDNETISKLLKTYNETVENTLFSFYDDRYLIETPLTRFVRATICSVKEFVSSSIQGHPGWTDINIMLSKNTFSEDQLESNPAAEFDEYWGMKRLLNAMLDDDINKKVLDTIKDSGYTLGKDSLLGQLEKACNTRVNGSSPATRVAVETVLNGIARSSNDSVRNSLEFNAAGGPPLKIKTTRINGLSPVKQQLAQKAAEFADWLEKNKASLDKIDAALPWKNAWDASKFIDRFPYWTLELYSIIIDQKENGAKDPRYASPEYLTALDGSLLKGPPKDPHVTWNKQSANKDQDKKFELVKKVMAEYTNSVLIGEFFNPAFATIEKGEFIQFVYTGTSAKDSEAVGRKIASMFAATGIAIGFSKEEFGWKAPLTWPKFSVSVAQYLASYEINATFVYEDTITPLLTSSYLSRLTKALDDQAKDIKSKEIPDTLVLAVPHPAHRYYPGYYNFVKHNALESGTVGDWFTSDARKLISKKIGDIADTVKDSLSPVLNWQAWSSVYARKHLFGDESANEISNDPNNPYRVMEMITRPTSRRDTGRMVGDKVITEMQPLSDALYMTEVQRQNQPINASFKYGPKDMPYSGMSSLIFSHVTDKITTIGNKDYKEFRQYRKQSFVQDCKLDIKGGPVQSLNVRDNFNLAKFQLGGQIGGSLSKVGDLKPQDLHRGLTEYPDGCTNLDSVLSTSIKSRTLVPEQMKWMTAQCNPEAHSEAVEMDKKGNWQAGAPSADGLSQEMAEKERQRVATENKVLNKPFTEDMKWATVDEALVEHAKCPEELISDEIVRLFLEYDIQADWTLGGRSRTIQQIKAIALTAMRAISEEDSGARYIYNKYHGDLVEDDSTIIRNGKFVVLQDLGMIEQAKLWKTLLHPNLMPKTASSLQYKLAREMLSLRQSVKPERLKSPLTFEGVGNVMDQNVKDRLFNYKQKVKNGQSALYGKNVQNGKLQLLQEFQDLSNSTKMVLTEKLLHSFLPTSGIMNAFPTYKLYIISSDTSEYKYYSLDDYYDFRLMQDVMVVRSKGNPAHMLKARIIVDPRYITTDGAPQQKGDDRLMPAEYRKTGSGIYTIDTAGEKFFSMGRCPLRNGMRVSLKLGYHTDPRMMDTVFIGTIIGISGTMESGIYEIEAQGDGRELLTQATSSTVDISGNNYREVVAKILRSNTAVTHFGRTYGSYIDKFSREHYVLMGLAQAGINSNLLRGGGAIAATAALFGAPAIAATALVGCGIGAAALTFSYMSDPSMGRRFVHDLSVKYKGIIDQKAGSFMTYLKGSIYDIEKASRQAALALHEDLSFGNDPIDDNIFLFDIWSGGPGSSFRINNSQRVWQVLEIINRLYPGYALDVRPYGNRSTLFMGPIDAQYWRTDDPFEAMAPQLYETSDLQMKHDDKVRQWLYNIVDRDAYGGLLDNSKNASHLIPFQKQHMVSSDSDIIMNGIKSTPSRGWNSVVVMYAKDQKDLIEDKAPFIELVADADIEPGAIRKVVAKLDWTDNQQIAHQYAAGFLKEGVEKLYGGTLIIRGNPKVEPYDRIYVADSVNRMFGWIEVETVIHKFDHQMGFTTHIVPNMVCAINRDTFVTTGKMLLKAFANNMGAVTLANAGMFVGGFIAGSAIIGALGISAPWLLGLALAGAAATSISSAMSIYKKYAPDASTEGDRGYLLQSAYLISSTNQSVTFAKIGYVLGSTRRMWKEFSGSVDPGAVSIKAAISEVATSIGNKVNKGSAIIAQHNFKKTFNQIPEIAKISSRAAINAAMANPEAFLKEKLAELKAKHPDNPLFDEKTGALKDLESSAKKAADKKAIVDAARETKVGQAVKTAGETIKWGNVGTGLAKGTFVYLAMEGIAYIPAFLETLCLKAMTKASVMSVSPVWSRNSLLMGGLDGWKNDDAFFHMKGMVINAKRTIDEVVENVSLYKPLTFVSGMTGPQKESLEGAQAMHQGGGVGNKQALSPSLEKQGLDVGMADRAKNISAKVKRYSDIYGVNSDTIMGIMATESQFIQSIPCKEGGKGGGMGFGQVTDYTLEDTYNRINPVILDSLGNEKLDRSGKKIRWKDVYPSYTQFENAYNGLDSIGSDLQVQATVVVFKDKLKMPRSRGLESEAIKNYYGQEPAHTKEQVAVYYNKVVNNIKKYGG